MSATTEFREGRVEVTFLGVPTRDDLVTLRAAVTKLARARPGGVAVLATITPGGLGILDEPARQYMREGWPDVRRNLSAVAVVVEGDGMAATLTRGFVRMLATTLGRAWTVHADRAAALRHLAGAARDGTPVR